MRWLVILFASTALAQGPSTKYDEASVPAYSLPSVLGTVHDKAGWESRRRPEILELYRREVFGRTPSRVVKLEHDEPVVDRAALGGKAVRKQVHLWFPGKTDGPRMDLLIYLPAGVKKPAPMFLGLGFHGNESVSLDPGIRLGTEWVVDPATKKRVKRASTEKDRGSAASRWPVEKILAAGYGLATMNYADIEPDFDGGMVHGVRPLFFAPGQTAPAADEWGAIGAWAWGLSRAMDYLETDREVDAKHVAVIGHSRLGKTSLWAGAQDTRFGIVISNDSGEGGAAISRREIGERVKDLNRAFPHWFCANFRKYDDREDAMPVDSHMLLALAAPRPLYVASAAEDKWADPRGEFLGAVHASPVYEMLGKQGIGTDKMPAVGEPVQHTVAYHIRSGKHDITSYDWGEYLKFAEMSWPRMNTNEHE